MPWPIQYAGAPGRLDEAEREIEQFETLARERGRHSRRFALAASEESSPPRGGTTG